jgi:hypothetical protein
MKKPKHSEGEWKVAQVVVAEPAWRDLTRLDPGTYYVRMPVRYDPATVTGVDILHDWALTVVPHDD